MATARIPSHLRKLVVHNITNKFRDAVKTVSVQIPQLGPTDLLVKTRFVGINASDINYTAGKYDPKKKPPFDAGFEGVGVVVDMGDACKGFSLGQPVGYMKYGSFADYVVLSAKTVFPLPEAKAEYVPCLVSGLTAAVSLDKVGEIKSGETVLVTAAAGGTGQFAVQLAKNAGCHVIGTCSTDDKVEFLKSIGCDRPVNYKKENLNEVLKKEYPRGIDVVYESVGGEMFNIALGRLALHGRLIVIGFISGYETDLGFIPTNLSTLPQRILPKSASVRGFFLFHHYQHFKKHFQNMISLISAGNLKSIVDNGRHWPTGPFRGLDSVPNAVDYLYSGKSVGKIVVEFPDEEQSKL
ncbi:prostaglandin reductase-3-like [Lingula anatina]|uniref:15-oxoprostaglandin 13-reductase n=1 Tax=Lingula anatina TaxID=7574 RepID=A0A1S3J8M4_LINAN|nr:prostaglandin reductase-3-like [Lingula anatina]|eukprot:XP_013406757.1 prostaglandin reductase-3-like [Lingula anatina]